MKKITIWKIARWTIFLVTIFLIVGYYRGNRSTNNSANSGSGKDESEYRIVWEDDYIWVSGEYPKNPQVELMSSADYIKIEGMASVLDVKNTIGENVGNNGDFGGYKPNEEMYFKFKDPSIGKTKVPIKKGTRVEV